MFRQSILGSDGRLIGLGDELEQVDCDTVIIAVSQVPKDKLVLTTEGLKSNECGLLEIDENCQTTVPGVFAAGDVVQGPLTVVNAAAGAKRAVTGMLAQTAAGTASSKAEQISMHAIDCLLTNYGSDPRITSLLDGETVYVIPRISPDGAETYLKTPNILRSVDREYLPEKGGIYDQDLDQDGVVRMPAPMAKALMPAAFP